MKLAANISLMFTEYPLLDRFSAAATAGFKAVEIQFPYDLPAEQLRQVKEAANIELVLINVPAGDLMTGGQGLACVDGRQNEFREAVAKAEAYALALDVPQINVLSGRATAGEDAVSMQVFQDNLIYAAKRFAAHGVQTTFEAINTHDMPDFLIHSAEQMWEIIDTLSCPDLKAQYDIYHMSRMGEDLTSDLKLHVDDIGHIQFADVPDRGEPGSGTLPLTEIWEQIQASSYSGYVAAEYRPTTSTGDSLGWMREFPGVG